MGWQFFGVLGLLPGPQQQALRPAGLQQGSTHVGMMCALCSLQAKQKGGFKAETEEEFEDAQGNVYNKRTYLDLKKQGLL